VRHCKRQERGVVGVQGVRNGEEFFPFSPNYGVWWSVVSSLRGVQNGALAKNEFGAFQALQNTSACKIL